MRAGYEHVAEEFFSVKEIAAVAGVGRQRVHDLIAATQVVAYQGLICAGDAAQLVRELGDPIAAREARPPISGVSTTRRRATLPLALSAAVHGAMLLAIVGGMTLGLLTPPESDHIPEPVKPVPLVYLMVAGPGGGGGGGLQLPAPPPPEPKPKAEITIRRTERPAPVLRRPQPLPPPRPVRTLEMARAEQLRAYVPPRPAPPAVKAPVMETSAPSPAPPAPAAMASLPVSNTVGTGSGSGEGAGLGPGMDAGTGGGPFRPGSGINPPSLLREVRPTYTEEARKRSIEGDVVLEIVVLRDGRVGNVSIKRRLGAGLDDRAVQAVRQWRFAPARRHGAAVDVVVEVSVAFSLR